MFVHQLDDRSLMNAIRGMHAGGRFTGKIRATNCWVSAVGGTFVSVSVTFFVGEHETVCKGKLFELSEGRKKGGEKNISLKY